MGTSNIVDSSSTIKLLDTESNNNKENKKTNKKFTDVMKSVNNKDNSKNTEVNNNRDEDIRSHYKERKVSNKNNQLK